jgi:hypothetical protein
MRLYLELPSWASWLHRPLDILSLPLLYLLILPLTAVYHILLFLLYGAPQGWELRHYLYLNLRRVGSQYGSYRRLPPIDPEEDILPARAEMYLPKCEYVRVTCRPMSKEVPRVGVLQKARGVVRDKDVTGFMIRKRGLGTSGVSASRGSEVLLSSQTLRIHCGSDTGRNPVLYHLTTLASRQADKSESEARVTTCCADARVIAGPISPSRGRRAHHLLHRWRGLYRRSSPADPHRMVTRRAHWGAGVL